MKNFAAFLFCGVLTAFSARAETVVTTTTTTTTTTTSGNVAANVTYTPSVVTYAPAVSRVIVNPQAGEDELYHRHLPAPRFYGSPVLAVGAPTLMRAQSLAERELPGLPGLIVTPRDADVRVRELARVVGFGLTLALHPGLSVQDVARFLA